MDCFFLQIISYFPSILLALYIALNPISEESHKLMATSLMENFNENCYMSCELLKQNLQFTNNSKVILINIQLKFL